MKIKAIMTTGIETIPPNASLQDAANLMKQHNIGSLPICDGNRLVGMLTDRDLTIRALSENRDCQKTMVKDIMSTPIVYCYEDQDTEEVARLMEVKKIRRVVVLDRSKNLVGIASIDNFAENQALAGEILANLTHSIHSEAA